jgi:hypothetical protein
VKICLPRVRGLLKSGLQREIAQLQGALFLILLKHIYFGPKWNLTNEYLQAILP